MRTTKHKSTSSKPIRSVYPLFTNAPAKTSNEFYVVVNPVSKLYTDDMGWLSIRSCSGHRYIMLAFNCDSNVILIEPFQPCHDRHRIAVYIRIMTRLQERGHAVDLQVLEKEASAEYRRTITQPWKGKFQLVPPDVHCRNAAEHAIRTFKAHFLASIAGVDRAFPSSLWDTLLPQMELTLKLLRQATLAPEISAWEYYKEPINYDATLLSPIGCKVAIHNKPGPRKTWDFRAWDGFSIGSALHHYRCHTVVDTTTKAVHTSNTVEFYHYYLTQPTITPEDRIVHALHFLSCSIKDVPATMHNERLEAPTCIHDIFLPQQTQPDPREKPLVPPRVRSQRPNPPVPPPSPAPVHTPVQHPRVDTLAAPPAIPQRTAIGN